MSATKNYLHDYTEAFDLAWLKLEEAIVAMQALNDMHWDEGGDTLINRASRADVALLRDKVRELTGEMGNFESVQEPIRRRVLLPGELDLI